jgi:hypothetical protein
MNTLDNTYIEEEISLLEFSEKFIGNNDFSTPNEYDISDREIEILTETGYKRILSFLVKQTVSEHYSDGRLNGTSEHKIVENGTEISLKNHSEFKKISSPMKVVDIEVDGGTYLANGRNNHNTTSGGKALAFHASVRIRLKSTGSIKMGDQPIGIKTKAVVIKNRMGPPLRSAEFNIFFDRGIDAYGSWLETLLENSIIKDAKAVKEDKSVKKSKKQQEEESETKKKAKSLRFSLPVEGKEPEIVNFEKKDFPSLLKSRPEVREYLYNQLCELCTMKYKSPDSDLEDEIEVDEKQEGLEE